MLISKRRFKWGCLLLLTGSAVLMIRPLRSWVDYAAVKQFDADLQVQHVTFHRKKSVLELNDLRWRKYFDGCAFGLSAEQAWLAIEQKPLLDRKLIIPRGEIERASLFLNHPSPIVLETSDHWRSELTEFLSEPDWDTILEQFTDALSPAEQRSGVQGQVDRWLARSAEIHSRILEIGSEFSTTSNPLRYEEELRRKIAQVDELLQEQSSLARKAEEAAAHLESRCFTLQKELSLYTGRCCREILSSPKMSDTERKVAESIVLSVAHNHWKQFRDYARISELVASHLPRWPRRNFDQNMLSDASEDIFVSISDLHVNGIFHSPRQEAEFDLRAHATARHNDEALSGTWEFRFRGPQFWIGASLCKTDGSGPLELEMKQFANMPTETSSPSDQIFGQPAGVEEGWQQRNDYLTRLTLHTGQEQIQGKLEISARSADPSTESGRMFEQALVGSGGHLKSFAVCIHGDWQTPRLTLDESLPDWLSRALQAQVRDYVIHANSHADARIRKAFDERITNLQSSIRRMIEGSNTVLQRQQQQLRTARADLQRRLDDLTGNIFVAQDEQGMIDHR